MDPATLSTGLIALLTPLIPYLTGLGTAAANAAADRAAKAIGEAGVQRSAALWDRLWPRLRGRGPAREAVAAIAADPTGTQARATLAREVAVLLARDPELARQAAALLRQAGNAGATIDVGDIRVKGDQNIVQVGEANISIGRAEDVSFGDRSDT